jgi:non-ribosomal peptide synthetase component F
MAGFKTLLARYTGQEDLVVGSPVANRPYPELEGLLGYFVNPLPMRSDLSGDPTFLELLAREREANQAAFEHQSLPFENLVQAVQPQRSLTHSPLFQTLFVLQNTPRDLRARDVRFEPLTLESGTVKFDLTLTVEEDAGGLRGWLGYRTDLLHADTIARMARNFVTLLADAAGAAVILLMGLMLYCFGEELMNIIFN